VDVGDVSDVSEVRADSIFWVDECKVVEFLCIYRFMFRRNHGGKWGVGVSPSPRGPVDRESCATDPSKGYRMHKKPPATAVNLLDNSESVNRLKRYSVLNLPDRFE
jgi:hypothetical protein